MMSDLWRDFKAGIFPGLLGTLGVLVIYLLILMLHYWLGEWTVFAVVTMAIFFMFSVLIGQYKRSNNDV